MKSTKVKRLSLNKKTIANLNNTEMRNIFAGQPIQHTKDPLNPITDSCQTCPPECVISTYTLYTCPPWSCGALTCEVPVPVHDPINNPVGQ
jgi:hypothetical protein